jgi:hypothetical protein
MNHYLITANKLLKVCLVASLLLVSQASFAKQYKVEVIVFENLQPQAAYENYRYTPLADISSPALTWEIEPSMLQEDAKIIEEAENYRLLHHYSWGQETLPVSEAAVYGVAEEYLQGWFKIYAGQLLFANIDIDFNGYRMIERRRLKLDEKHFFDHPKFGVMMQVSRLEPSDEDFLSEPTSELPATEE